MPTINKWITKTVNIDQETGEVLTDRTNYYKLKSIKETKIEEYGHKTIGYVQWTIIWKRKLEQLRIDFPGNE